jgi:hypothetical protein
MTNAAIATLPAPPPAVPFNGLGMFYASGDVVADPVDRAKLVLEAGATTAFVLIESVEGTQKRAEVVASHAIELRTRMVEPWLFTFPTSARIPRALEHLRVCGERSQCRKVVLDIEPWTDPKTGIRYDWTEAQIKQLVDGARALGFEVMITLFSRAAWKRIRWDRVAPGIVIILQVYDRVKDEEALSDAVAAFPDSIVVLAIGTYVGDLERLRHDLHNARPYAQHTGAIAVWVLKTTSHEEARTLCGWVVTL